MNLRYFLFLIPILIFQSVHSQDLRNTPVNGYRGIWFELNQKYAYGDKYSGGLGTYTAKHRPMAIYAAEVNTTYFVYGGTTTASEKHLLCMIGSFDHSTGLVSKPLVVYDKMGVDDPHDNPSISMDTRGYLWVFVSGRGNLRPGIKLRSKEPYDISSFEIISEEVFTYPQIWKGDSAFLHFFTKYTGIRELYFERSRDGFLWTEDIKLAGIKGKNDSLSGHYQLSSIYKGGEIAGTFFSRHINGNVDTRTNLYYLETRDLGSSWQTGSGQNIDLPVVDPCSESLVTNYQSQGRNVYLKDMAYDLDGSPVCLFLTSGGHEPGPGNAPYSWMVSFYRNKQWQTGSICESDHNYDMGSLYIQDEEWLVVAPTEEAPQAYGVGGEIAIWESRDQGESWNKLKQLTHSSPLNHAYIRRPLNHEAPFCFFWASGDPGKFSTSELYFGDFSGSVWKLPYHMKGDFGYPEKLFPMEN
jgi:hypothetical protein